MTHIVVCGSVVQPLTLLSSQWTHLWTNLPSSPKKTHKENKTFPSQNKNFSIAINSN